MAEFRVALGAVADIATSQEVKDAVSGLQGHIDRRVFGNGLPSVNTSDGFGIVRRLL